MSTTTTPTVINPLLDALGQQTLQKMQVGGVTHALVRITPKLAQLMLGKNVEGNRKQKSQVLNTYEQEMLRGNWLYAGDPIRFDTTGAMIDGQHRCESIVMAGTFDPAFSVVNLVILGLDPKVKEVIDQGSKRRTGEQLSMILGTPSATTVAAAVRVILVHEAGLNFKDNKTHAAVTTTPLIVEWVETHKQDVEFMTSNIAKANKSHLSPSVVAAAAVLFSRIDAESAQLFLDRLADGANLTQGNPILAMRERAINNKMNKMGDTKRDQLGMLIKAWNYWLEGKSLRLMKLPVGGWTESNFPTLGA